MTNPTTPAPTARSLARLRRDLKLAGVTHQMVADAASPRVRKQHVTHVLAGDYRSANVVETAKRLLAGANARHGGATC